VKYRKGRPKPEKRIAQARIPVNDKPINSRHKSNLSNQMAVSRNVWDIGTSAKRKRAKKLFGPLPCSGDLLLAAPL
jgi:hypothetical protein